MSKFFDPNFPFRPKSVFPFFYGWIILIVSTIGLIMSIPGQTIGVSVFTDFLIESLGLSRVQLSTAYMLGTITSSFFLPWSGRLYDRIGARAMVVFCTAILGSILVVMSQCDRIAQLLSPGVGINLVVAFVIVYIGFSLMRFSGQGMLAMTSRAMLGKWFQTKRGFVSGINGVFAMFFFSLGPLMLDFFVRAFDWRGAWLVMAAIIFGMLFLGWLTYRDNPEECDLQMDGGDQTALKNPDGKPAHPIEIQHEYTYEEAVRTYAFWIYNLSLSIFALTTTAVTFHIVSIGESAGLDRDQSLFIFFPMAVVSIMINILFTFLTDLVKLKYMLMVLLASMVVAVYGTYIFNSSLGQWLMIVGFGIGQGIFAPLMTYIWPTFFGRKHLGAISSFNLSCQVFASAIGPFLFGASHDWFGSYQWGIFFCLFMPLILLVTAFWADNPQKEIAQD